MSNDIHVQRKINYYTHKKNNCQNSNKGHTC